MAASYPSSIVALSTKNDGDTIFAAHVDALQDETIAVETALLNGFQHDLLPLNDDNKSLGSTSKRWLKAWLQDMDLDGTLTLSGGPLLSTTTVTTVVTQTALPIPPGSGDLTIFLNNPSLLLIQGIAPGVDGQHLRLVSVNAQVDLAHQNGAAGSSSRLVNFVTSANTSILLGVAEYVYSSVIARWQLLTHEQNGAIAYTSTWGNNGTANTLGNGTLTATYILRGRQVYVRIQLVFGTSTIAGNGTWSFTVPFTSDGFLFGGTINLSHSANAYPGQFINVGGGTAFFLGTMANPAAAFANNQPFVWASTDSCSVFVTYGTT